MSSDRSTSTDQDELQSSNDQASVKHRSGPTSCSQAPIRTHKLRSSIDQDPRAPIKTHVLRSSTDQNPRAPICLFVGLSVWVCLCVGVGVFLCVHLRKKKMRRGKLSSLVVHREEREKKVRTEINIITNAHATVTVHICTVTIAIVHKCTIMHKLMWVVFFAQIV